MEIHQKTLAREVYLVGHGVHRGQRSQLWLRPAPEDYGIVFRRKSASGISSCLRAIVSNIGATNLSTTLGHGDARVETVEHLLAAIAALSIDNIDIEVSDEEIPILDGAARAFALALRNAGLKKQCAPRAYIRIKESVIVGDEHSYACFEPYAGTRFDVTIDFPSPLIGRQNYQFDLDSDTFIDEISPARTFGFVKDIEELWAQGFALGSSIDNSVVVGMDNELVNDRLYFDDEFVRHKLLDAIGDTALLGAPFLGEYRSLRAGHRRNADLVRRLLSTKNAYEIVNLPINNA